METEVEIKRQVRDFYDQVGWQQVSDGIYQNARYEDLRQVSREYIHRGHLRVGRHLAPSGELFLDAGSGPIQYPEYLEYSRGYRRRVCADISSTALQEARGRIGDHGLFVVADVARLPFKAGTFDAAISLHTIHHLPEGEHLTAYRQLHRVLNSGRSVVVVNGWNMPPLGRILEAPIRLRKAFRRARRLRNGDVDPDEQQKGTFVSKYNARWLRRQLRSHMQIDILVWRSVSVMVLRTYIHRKLGGAALLRALFWLEERFPRFFGQYGQYPLIVISK